MVGKLVRRLKEIDAEIRRETNRRGNIRFSILYEELIIAGRQKEIDRVTERYREAPETLVTGLALAHSIGEGYLKIRDLRKEMELCNLRIKALEEERELVSERLDRLTYNEQLRELDIYDYQTIIEKNGFIRGIKL